MHQVGAKCTAKTPEPSTSGRFGGKPASSNWFSPRSVRNGRALLPLLGEVQIPFTKLAQKSTNAKTNIAPNLQLGIKKTSF